MYVHIHTHTICVTELKSTHNLLTKAGVIREMWGEEVGVYECVRGFSSLDLWRICHISLKARCCGSNKAVLLTRSIQWNYHEPITTPASLWTNGTVHSLVDNHIWDRNTDGQIRRRSWKTAETVNCNDASTLWCYMDEFTAKDNGNTSIKSKI